MKPKTDKEIESIRRSGSILAAVFEAVRPAIKTGAKTTHIADIVKTEIEQRGATPVLLGYQGFPSVVCISVNDQVVHGIPSQRTLNDGDLVSLDLCVEYEGMITDSAFTVAVGESGATTARTRRLLEATEQALYEGIDQVKHGVRIGDISNAIQRRLLRDDLGIVESLVGHGVGHEIHEEPEVPNFGMAGTGPTLKSGMTIAIEPMATIGGKAVYLEDDGWTITTRDHSLSAHFEHTVLVTDDGYEVLTELS